MKSFAEQMADWEKEVNTKFDVAVQETVREYAHEVIERSPVDTGWFRGNWRVSTGAINSSDTGDYSSSIRETQNKVDSEIGGIKAGEIIYFTNPTEYGYELEFLAHSKQAPAGMVRVTFAKINKIVDNAATKARES